MSKVVTEANKDEKHVLHEELKKGDSVKFDAVKIKLSQSFNKEVFKRVLDALVDEYLNDKYSELKQRHEGSSYIDVTDVINTCGCGGKIDCKEAKKKIIEKIAEILTNGGLKDLEKEVLRYIAKTINEFLFAIAEQKILDEIMLGVVKHHEGKEKAKKGDPKSTILKGDMELLLICNGTKLINVNNFSESPGFLEIERLYQSMLSIELGLGKRNKLKDAGNKAREAGKEFEGYQYNYKIKDINSCELAPQEGTQVTTLREKLPLLKIKEMEIFFRNSQDSALAEFGNLAKILSKRRGELDRPLERKDDFFHSLDCLNVVGTFQGLYGKSQSKNCAEYEESLQKSVASGSSEQFYKDAVGIGEQTFLLFFSLNNNLAKQIKDKSQDKVEDNRVTFEALAGMVSEKRVKYIEALEIEHKAYLKTEDQKKELDKEQQVTRELTEKNMEFQKKGAKTEERLEAAEKVAEELAAKDMETQKEMAEQAAEMAEQAAEIAEQAAEMAEQAAEIAAQAAEMAAKDAEIAAKDAEMAALREQLKRFMQQGGVPGSAVEEVALEALGVWELG